MFQSLGRDSVGFGGFGPAKRNWLYVVELFQSLGRYLLNKSWEVVWLNDFRFGQK